MLKNLLETSALQAGNFTEHPRGEPWTRGSRDHLAGKPEGQQKGHGKEERESLPASVFCSLEGAGKQQP